MFQTALPLPVVLVSVAQVKNRENLYSLKLHVAGWRQQAVARLQSMRLPPALTACHRWCRFTCSELTLEFGLMSCSDPEKEASALYKSRSSRHTVEVKHWRVCCASAPVLSCFVSVQFWEVQLAVITEDSVHRRCAIIAEMVEEVKVTGGSKTNDLVYETTQIHNVSFRQEHFKILWVVNRRTIVLNKNWCYK